MVLYTNKKPNIVLIVFDSARASNFSLYNYERRTNPYLEIIAESSVLYKNVISAAPSTVPSHASIFTGMHLSGHQLFMDKEKLSTRLLTLAEILQDQGYYTYGICYQDDVSPRTGLDRGFQEFHTDDESSNIKRIIRSIIESVTHEKNNDKSIIQSENAVITDRRHYGYSKKRFTDSDIYKMIYWYSTAFSDQGAESSFKKISRFLANKQREQPFFIYLHYDETHLPYRAPEPYRTRFKRNKKYSKQPWLVNQDRNKYFLKDVNMEADDFEILKDLYDGTIAYLDKKTNDIYNLLSKNDCIDNTIIIIIADHGDNIGEHGLMSHKFCLYDNLIKVPMLIKYPKDMNLRGEVDEIVQLTDITPTILDMLNINKSDILEQMQGNSLISTSIAKREKGYAIAELMKPFGNDFIYAKGKLREYNKRMISIRSSKYKYIWKSDDKHELYDMQLDPNEQKNIIGIDKSLELEKVMSKYLNNFEACYHKYKYRLD